MNHCREQSLSDNEELLGTASNHEAYLVVEAAFPWKHDVLETHDIAAFSHILQAMPARLQLIASDAVYSRKGYRQVLFFLKKQYSYDVAEFFVPRGKETEILPKILIGQAAAYCTNETHRHILVCIDGNHDYCCGRWGQPCYDALHRSFVEKDVRVWRTSHIGGHRFAPTLIDFPEGRWYGRVQDDPVAVLRKTGIFNPAVYRGNGTLPKELQSAECELLIHEGWNADISSLGL